jgi:hypothetical protein
MNNPFKLLLITLALAWLSIPSVFAQSPAAFKYQAVVRDANYAPIVAQTVRLRFSILVGSVSGSTVYQEFHQPTTSPLGLVALNVGEGTVLSGTFDAIDWGSDDYYLQIEVDPAGGSNYLLLGTSQLLSVPYALYATKAGSVDNLDEAFTAGAGIRIDSGVISNVAPSLWRQDSQVVLVDSSVVGIGLTDPTAFPDDAQLFVNGNVRIADDSALLGLGAIVGASGIRFAADSTREGDIELFNNGRVRFEEEVGINQVFSFVDLNVRNQAGNSTVFQVEDTSGSDLFEVGRTGNVGINQLTNNVTLQVQNRDTTGGITNNIIANFERANGDNVLQIQDDQDVVVTGDFSVNSGNKNFILDHPLDPANKILAHNAVESPDHVTYYHGTVQLDANGQATVSLPSYFEALNTDCHYQLTCIGAFAQVYVAAEIANNQFAIAGGQPGMKVSWQVSAKRNDPWASDHPYQAEQAKDPEDQGRYYYPEGYGLGREYKIGSETTHDETEEDR